MSIDVNGVTVRLGGQAVLDDVALAVPDYPVSAFLEALSLQNQFADLPTPFAELNTEQALAMTPDIVFVNYVGDEQAAIADLAAALPDLTAVKEDRVYGANEDLAQGSGVGIIDALEQVATAVQTATGN